MSYYIKQVDESRIWRKNSPIFGIKNRSNFLLDFAGVRVFESATVDTNILLFSKGKNNQKTICTITNKQDEGCIRNLSVYVQQQHSICSFSNSENWVILSPIEQSIKRKIEAVGTPLKDWDVQINYGIKTGYNEAFIISTDKRTEILANCKTEDERQRTDEIIRPILRGRDIKRYGYNWANLWLINTHNGIKGNLPRIIVEDYPAIKAHLDKYWDKIKDRADQGDTPYNLRNCAYMDDFNKPKIIYIEIMTDNEADGYFFPCFSYDDKCSVVLNTGYIMTSKTIEIKAILAILNSRMGRFILKLFVSQLQQRQFRMLRQYMNNVPLPCFDYNTMKRLTGLAEKCIRGDKNAEKMIDSLLFESYQLSEAEIMLVEQLD